MVPKSGICIFYLSSVRRGHKVHKIPILLGLESSDRAVRTDPQDPPKTHAKCCGHEARRGAAVVMLRTSDNRPPPPRRMSPGAAPAPRPTRQRTGGSSHGDVVGVRITERIPPRVAPAAALESVTV